LGGINKVKKIVSTILVCLCTLSLAACANKGSNNSSSSTKAHSSKVTESKTSKKEFSKSSSTKNSSASLATTSSSSVVNSSSSSSQADSSTKNTSSDVGNLLIGKKYTVEPSKYDDIDVNTAMNENKAPQNIVSDYDYNIDFTGANTATYHQMGKDFNASYSVSNGSIIIKSSAGTQTLPYSLNNGTITFNNFTTNETTSNGSHKITWTVEKTDY
jgi:hypothetical protein